MTPQAYSYPTVGPDNLIYIPPYGLKKELKHMLCLDPETLKITKLRIVTNGTTEKYTQGIVSGSLIVWIPYGDSRVLIRDTNSRITLEIPIPLPTEYMSAKGKYVQGHLYNNKIYALPYGENCEFDYVLVFDLLTLKASVIKLNIPNNDKKKWHQSVIRDGIIYAAPRGERKKSTFNYAIEFNCNTHEYILKDITSLYKDTSMKYTTIAIANNIIYAPPYGYRNDLNEMLVNKNNEWTSIKLDVGSTTRKYFGHVKTKNNKLYFPPAGHEIDWNKFLVIDGNNGQYKTFDVPVGKESKKYFVGAENSEGLVFFIPRGGCVCDLTSDWKKNGDLAEILVINSKDDSFSTIDISQCFTDNTTIEKYNACCILNDVIYAFPYGESETFQTVLIYDTVNNKIKTLDLNEIL
jgi:hypothetical protein